MRNALVIVLGIVSLSILPNAAHAISVTQNVADFTSNPGVTSNLAPASSSFWSVQTDSVAGLYRSPFENFTPAGSQGPGYGNQYASIQQGGSAVYNFASPQNLLSILWGSPDTYNKLSLYSGVGGTGSNLFSLTGGDLSIQTFGHDQVQIGLGNQSFLSVLLTSTGNAFEFANLQASDVTATPLPPAVLLFASGLGLVGLLAARRKAEASA